MCLYILLNEDILLLESNKPLPRNEHAYWNK